MKKILWYLFIPVGAGVVAAILALAMLLFTFHKTITFEVSLVVLDVAILVWGVVIIITAYIKDKGNL